MEAEFGASEAAIQLVQCWSHKHKELSWSAKAHIQILLSWGSGEKQIQILASQPS